MSRLLKYDPNSESTCNAILIRNVSKYRNYVHDGVSHNESR